MRILIVVSGQRRGVAAYVRDLEPFYNKSGILFEYFYMKEKGLKGYLISRRELIRELVKGDYNLIHAHYGLSGLLASLQWRTPVVITFHGSDINNRLIRPFSKLAYILSTQSIFVSAQLKDKLKVPDGHIIPCGVDEKIFHPLSKNECRKKLGIDMSKKIILFSSSFDNPVKNAQLAFDALSLLKEKVELVELKEMSREQVALWMNAVDVCLLTSFTEGSPQFIKEAIAVGTPVVSTDVGDVAQLFGKASSCYLTSFDPKDVAEKITKALYCRSVASRGTVLYSLKDQFYAVLEVYNNTLRH